MAAIWDRTPKRTLLSAAVVAALWLGAVTAWSQPAPLQRNEFTTNIPFSSRRVVTNILNGALHAGTGILITTNSGGATITLYDAPVIDSFVNDQNYVEIGSTVSQTVLDWSLSGGAITSQSLNHGVGALNIALRSYTDPVDYTTNRTYTLTVSDGTTTLASDTTVTFLSKAYWGVSANTSLNDAQVIALSSEFATGIARSKVVSPVGQYIYFAYPASFGAASFTVNGLANTAWTLVTRSFVNASGYALSYHIYRSDNLLTGTYTVALQ